MAFSYYSEQNVISIAKYIVDNKATVRQASEEFGYCKNTIHNYVTKYLIGIDLDLYDKVRDVLELNKLERALRGGLATKKMKLNKIV